MLWTIGIILLVLWLIGWVGVHIMSAAIHLLVVLALICFAIAFFWKA